MEEVLTEVRKAALERFEVYARRAMNFYRKNGFVDNEYIMFMYKEQNIWK